MVGARSSSRRGRPRRPWWAAYTRHHQWLTCRTWWWGRGRAARRGRPRRLLDLAPTITFYKWVTASCGVYAAHHGLRGRPRRAARPVPPPSRSTVSHCVWWGRGRADRRGRPRRPWWAAPTITTQWLTCRTWWWGRGRAAEGDDHVGHGELRTSRRSDLLVERDGGGDVEQHEGDDHVGHGELRTQRRSDLLVELDAARQIAPTIMVLQVSDCLSWWYELEQHEGGHGELRTHDAVTYL